MSGTTIGGVTSEENSKPRANSMRAADTRIIPVKRANKAKTVQKLESGDLRVTLNSGRIFDISKDNAMFQEFVVWTMLNSECTE
jgi:hypothetical protein